MPKLLLCLICGLIVSLPSLSQSRHNSPVDSIIQACLQQKKMQSHQSFEFRTGVGYTYIDIYNGIPDSLLIKYDSLMADSKLMIADMGRLIRKIVDITKVEFHVVYFDRNSLLYTKDHLFTASFKDGKTMNFTEYPEKKDELKNGDTLQLLIEQLHHIQLLPSQHFVPLCEFHEPSGENVPFAVHLVTLTDSLPSKRDLLSKSKRQFGWLARQLRGFPYLKQFQIAYQQRNDVSNVITFNYAAPQW